MSGGMQTSVNTQPAPAVAGDFCDSNPHYSVDIGPGGFVAGALGVVVGRACWATPPDDANGAYGVLNSFGTGPIAGIVKREQQAIITTFLADGSMVIPQGFPVTAFNGGGFWVKNDGATQAVPGQKAYANFADGKFTFKAAATPTTGASATGSTIAAATSSVTGSIADNILTVSAVLSGVVYPGTTLSGTGVASGSKVVSQVLPLIGAETLGGVGRYYVSIPEQTVASTTVSGTYGLFTVGTATGTFAVNGVLAATGAVVAGTTITAAITGAGGTASTFAVDNNTVVSSQTISVAAINVETSFVCKTSGLAGELVKVTNAPVA